MNVSHIPPPAARSVPAVSVRFVLRAIRRRFWSGALAGVACLLTVTTILALLPYRYEASARILVKVGRDQAPGPSVGDRTPDQIITTGVRPEDVASEIEIITSPPVIDAALGALGPDFGVRAGPADRTLTGRARVLLAHVYHALEDVLVALNVKPRLSDREKLMGRIVNGLAVERIARSDMIGARVRWSSAEDAGKVLEAVLTAYVAVQREARGTFRAEAMFRDLVSEFETRMAAEGAAIGRARRNSGLYAAESQITTGTQRLAALDAEAQGAALQSTLSEARLSRLNAQRAAVAQMPLDHDPAGSDELLNTLQRRLVEVRLDQVREAQRFGDRSEQVRLLDAPVAALRQAIRDADLAQLQRAIEAEHSQLELLQARDGKLAQQRAEVRGQLDGLLRARVDIEARERQYAGDVTAYKRVRAQQDDSAWLARLDREGVSTVRVIGGVRAFNLPASPKKLLLLAMGIGISLIVSVSTMLILEWTSLDGPRTTRDATMSIAER